MVANKTPTDKSTKKRVTKKTPAKKSAPKKRATKKTPAPRKARTRKVDENKTLVPSAALDKLLEEVPERKGGVSLEERGKAILSNNDCAVDWSDIDVWEVFSAVFYANAGNLTKTCKQLGMTTTGYYAALIKYPEFHAIMDITKERTVDVLEAEAIRRAVDGVEKGIYYKGELVATEVQYSDKLLLEALKARNPDYRTKVTEHQGPGGGPVQAEVHIMIPNNQRDPEIVEAKVIKDEE
jgi:hypothetical protein